MSKLIMPLLVLVLSPFIATALADDGSDKRLRYLASRLDALVPVIDKGDQPLSLLLENISASTSEPGYEKAPEKAVAIVVNADAFQSVQVGFTFERTVIKFDSKLTRVSLGAVLRLICAQMNAGYVVRKDYIEILPIEVLRKELNHPYGPVQELRTLITRFYDNVSLESAFGDLAKSRSRTIVLSPKIRKELAQNITVHLINAPFETAVESLADAHDLALVRKSSAWLVTTKEQAAELNLEHEKRLKAATEQAAK